MKWYTLISMHAVELIFLRWKVLRMRCVISRVISLYQTAGWVDIGLTATKPRASSWCGYNSRKGLPTSYTTSTSKQNLEQRGCGAGIVPSAIRLAKVFKHSG